MKVNRKMEINIKSIEKFVLPQIYILRNGDEAMKISKMSIDNICGIKHLDITFNERLNLICGENGVGKTTILKAIAYQFIFGHDSFIKKYYGSEKGKVSIVFDNVDTIFNYEIKDFVPGYLDRYNTNDREMSNNILFFSSSRTIDYYKIDALPPVTVWVDDEDVRSAKLLTSGVDKNIKSWFVNRLLFYNVADSLTIFQKNNLELCKRVFGLLDQELSVKTAKPDFEIVLSNRKNEIYFEMLSDGYKSCVFILLGIIKEIEYRYPSQNAVDFDGIIMIDEIDIHLHPQWQAKLVEVLTETFPKAQIIATTHSPSVLQNAKANEIIPLYRDAEDNICIKELHLGEYGLQGWTLEEILEDVMGMPSTTSELYLEIHHKFDKALNEECQEEILKYYEILKKMLHPKNPMLQILEIQVAEWKN